MKITHYLIDMKKQQETFEGHPVYDATMNDLDFNHGFHTVSFVKLPATKQPIFMFSKEEPMEIKFGVADEQRGLVTGVMMLADTKIERVFPKGHPNEGEKFFIQFPKEMVEQMSFKAMIDKRLSNVNIEHDKELKVDNVNIVESWIFDKSRGGVLPKYLEGATDGSWIVTLKVDNKEVLQLIKDGVVLGLSLEGNFDMQQKFSKDELQLSDIKRKLSSKDSVNAKYNAIVALLNNE